MKLMMTTSKRKRSGSREENAIAKSAPNEMPSAAWTRRFQRRMLTWFSKNARDLPWRVDRDPYHVWVSEIMLQQTQVATVVEYFNRFMREFPTVSDLARADESQVLKLWEGLGYYRRARSLHRAAKAIVQLHGGEFPRDREMVAALPGIGRYTTGAILSIAFGAREPILEANTVRLFSRLLAYDENPTDALGQRTLWLFAERILPNGDCGAMNQSLMELGATVCTPKNPHCERCPVMDLCAAKSQLRQHAIPSVTRKLNYEDANEVAIIVTHNGREKVLVRRYEDGVRWHGLWDFPRWPAHPDKKELNVEYAKENLRVEYGIEIGDLRFVATLRHGVTRFRIRLDCFAATWKSGAKRRNNWKWVTWPEFQKLPRTTPARKMEQLFFSTQAKTDKSSRHRSGNLRADGQT